MHVYGKSGWDRIQRPTFEPWRPPWCQRPDEPATHLDGAFSAVFCVRYLQIDPPARPKPEHKEPRIRAETSTFNDEQHHFDDREHGADGSEEAPATGVASLCLSR